MVNFWMTYGWFKVTKLKITNFTLKTTTAVILKTNRQKLPKSKQ